MGSAIQLFTNEEYGTIRAIKVDGEPWFVAKDICDALGIGNITMAMNRLDEDEFSSTEVIDSMGRAQQTKIVSEAGMYSLVMASKKPEAKAFKRWVTHDVLPSIRQHGMYATPQTVEQMLNDPDTMIATLTALKAERQRVAALVDDNARLLPKATMYDVAIEADGTMSITQAARYLSQTDKSMNRKRLFALLRADGFICKQDNAPTKKAIERGYMIQMLTTRSDGKANDPYARMTRKGLDWCMTHYCTPHALA